MNSTATKTTIAAKLKAVTPPLRKADGNSFRVGNTRIPLERVVYAFNHGSAPEEIVHKYPTLNLADVYAVLAFYLRNQDAVDEYVMQKSREADEAERMIRSEFPTGEFRTSLQARRSRKP